MYLQRKNQHCILILSVLFCSETETRYTLCTGVYLYPTRFRNAKQKPMRGGDLRQIKTCRKVPLHVHFFGKFGIAFCHSNLSTYIRYVTNSCVLRVQPEIHWHEKGHHTICICVRSS
jgi:hypothetical protein